MKESDEEDSIVYDREQLLQQYKVGTKKYSLSSKAKQKTENES